MRLFVSWSGNLSHQAARALRDFLPRLLPRTEILLWDDNSLQAGSTWQNFLEQELSRADVAAPCLTSENVRSPWLNFEAGLLYTKIGNQRVVPLLVDLSVSQIHGGPFSQFQCFSTSKPDFKRFVGFLADVYPDDESSEAKVDSLFETWWPAISSSLPHSEAKAAHGRAAASRGSMRRVQNLDALKQVVTRQPTDSDLESVLVATMRESGVRVIRRADKPETGADLAIWVDQTDSELGNPILVELKHRISDRTSAAQIADQASQYVNRSGTRTIFVIYNAGLDPTQLNRDFGSLSVIFIRFPDLLERLEEESLDFTLRRAFQEQRTRLTSGGLF